MTIKDIKVQSASEAFQILENFTQDFFRFRGHSDEQWRLQSTLSRHHMLPPDETTAWEIDDMMDHFVVQLKSIGVKIPFKLYDRRARLEFARHYGVPSPLIDFSYSPYVALFFAFNGIKPLRAKEGECAAVYCLNIHHLGGIWAKQNSLCSNGMVGEKFTHFYHSFVHGTENLFVDGYDVGVLKYIDMPASWNQRMQRQLGVFIYDTLDYRRLGIADLQEYLDQAEIPGEDVRNKEVLIRVLIPHEFGREIFERLELMGISAAHLFGNSDGAALDVINAYNYGRKIGRAWNVRIRGKRGD